MFKDFADGGGKKKEWKTKLKNDENLCLEFAKYRDALTAVHLASKYGLDKFMVIELGAFAHNLIEDRKIDKLTITIKCMMVKDGLSVSVTGISDDTVTYLNGIDLLAGEHPGQRYVMKLFDTFCAHFDEKNGKLVAAPKIIGLKNALTPNHTKCSSLEAKFAASNVKTVSELKSSLLKEYVGDDKKVVLGVVLGIAPEQYAPKFKNNRLTPLNAPGPVAKNRMRNLGACHVIFKGMPTKCNLRKLCAQHIYGVKLPKDILPYFNAVVDFAIPDEFKNVIIYSKDQKFATLFSNIYPKKKVYYLGDTVKDPVGSVFCITKDRFAVLSKEEKTVTVFPKITHPTIDGGKWELGVAAGDSLLNKYKQCTSYMGYMSVFSVAGSEKLCYASIRTMDCVVVISNVKREMTSMSSDDAIHFAANAMVNAYVYPWTNSVYATAEGMHKYYPDISHTYSMVPFLKKTVAYEDMFEFSEAEGYDLDAEDNDKGKKHDVASDEGSSGTASNGSIEEDNDAGFNIFQ